MKKPGLLVATSCLKDDASISPETFRHWYQDIHVPDVLAVDGAPPLAVHYTNCDPDAKWTNMMVFRLPDIGWVGSDSMKNIPKEWDGWKGPNGKPERGIVYADILSRAYEQVQVYEGPNKKPERGSYVVTAGIDIPEDMEGEYHEWMRLQHFPMVSMIPVFRRATIGKLLSSYHSTGLPKLFVMAEYDSPPPPQYMQIVRQTEWGKKMIGAFTRSEMNKWNMAMEFGKAKEGVDVSGF